VTVAFPAPLPYRRRTVVLAIAGAVGLATAPLVGGSPAVAASVTVAGPLLLTPTSGTVAADPMFATARATKTCPVGFGTNVALKIGRAGGPTMLLSRLGSDFNYDKVAPTVPPNRSMATALGGPPSDGPYLVTLECFAELGAVSSQVFAASLTVTNGQWRVVGTPTSLPKQPTDTSGNTPVPGTRVNGTKVPAPRPPTVAAAPGGASAVPALPRSSALPTTPPITPPVTASAQPIVAAARDSDGSWWVLAVVLLAALAGGGVALARFRRR